MPWAERYRLGVAEMDATHREFIAAADALRGHADSFRMSPAWIGRLPSQEGIGGSGSDLLERKLRNIGTLAGVLYGHRHDLS